MAKNPQKVDLKLQEEQAKVLPIYTYFNNRKCEFCGEPIADQAKSTRTHCVYDNTDGVIKDCKTAKARQNDEEERELFRKHREIIKGIDKSISKMVKEKGYVVDLDALKAYDIDLCLGLTMEIKLNGQFTSTYINYKIEGGPFESTFKILKK